MFHFHKIPILNWTSARSLSQSRNVIKQTKRPVVKHIGEPLITCKRPEFNLHRGDKFEMNAELGKIPLTTDGWHHWKSKGDFFIIHPHSSTEDITQKPEFNQSFEKFDFQPELLQNLSSRLNMQRTTYVQHEAIPKILENKHTLLAAETGCGKTIAYLLPIIQNLLNWKQSVGSNHNAEFNTPKVLIITPGRELALQIGEVCEDLCNGLELKTKVQVGGHTKSIMMNPPIEEIDILVASIGCLSKFITTNIYRMHQVRHVVLDEADTLLDDSFSDQLRYILKCFPVRFDFSINCFLFNFNFITFFNISVLQKHDMSRSRGSSHSISVGICHNANQYSRFFTVGHRYSYTA